LLFVVGKRQVRQTGIPGTKILANVMMAPANFGGDLVGGRVDTEHVTKYPGRRAKRETHRVSGEVTVR
jgi:hypothetical protein